jgi:predicted RNA-binding Zn-ribbon protein involved in translation (DUF1610 family)
MKKTYPRILSIDCETAPISGYVWSLWQQNVSLNQINGEWSLLSFCAKWLGDDNSKIIYEDNSKRRNKLDDSRLIKSLWKLLDEADIIIAHNGKRFDSKKIQARMFLLGFPPPSPYKIIDTLIETRKNFAMTSAKLEYLTDKMCTTKKSKHKQFPGFELWKECLAGNQEAWDEMKAYNIDDVISMEEYYLLLRPWITGHPNVANYTSVAAEGPVCPNCGSEHVIRKGLRSTQVGQYPRYHCQGCGAWSRGRLLANSKDQRKNLLVN